MSEAMTSEVIAEALWLLKGYWTKLRFPFQTTKGAWSDIDVVAYNPEAKHIVICESKVRGEKRHVFAYTSLTAKKYGSIVKYDDNNYLSFLKNITNVCKDGVVFNSFSGAVKSITVRLISNYAIDQEVLGEVRNDVLMLIDESIRNKYEIDVRIDTTIDVISEVVELQDQSAQGKRYGHPVIDMVREINRYFHPDVRYAGRKKGEVNRVKAALVSRFKQATNMNE